MILVQIYSVFLPDMPQVDDTTVQLNDDEEDSIYESVLGWVKTFIMYDTRSKINSCHL